jgi:hypothetical protein
MEKISRRDFTKSMLGSLFSITLVSSLVEAQSLKVSVNEIYQRKLPKVQKVIIDVYWRNTRKNHE